MPIKTSVQTFFASPVVKKLRAIEQRRMAGIATRHAQRKERLVRTLDTVHESLREGIRDAVRESLLAQARSLEDDIQLLRDQAQLLDRDDDDDLAAVDKK